MGIDRSSCRPAHVVSAAAVLALVLRQTFRLLARYQEGGGGALAHEASPQTFILPFHRALIVRPFKLRRELLLLQTRDHSKHWTSETSRKHSASVMKLSGFLRSGRYEWLPALNFAASGAFVLNWPTPGFVKYFGSAKRPVRIAE
jgi:hypothetical protein